MSKNNKVLFILSFMLICINPLIEKSLGQDLPKYAPDSLIAKFTKSAATQEDFLIREEQARVITGLPTIDSLCAYYKASSFKPYYFELFNPSEDKLLGVVSIIFCKIELR